MGNEAVELKNQALTIPERATSLVIKDNSGFVEAGNILTTIKDLRKKIDSTFDPIIKKAHEAHKEAVKQKKEVDAPLVLAEQALKPKIIKYQKDQEEERRKAEEEAIEKAKKEAEDLQLKEAEKLQNQGKPEEAEKVLNQPVETPPVVMPTTTPKLPGISTREKWRFRIVDVNIIPREYMIPDEKAIGKIGNALKKNARIPGVEFYREDVVAAGSSNAKA